MEDRELYAETPNPTVSDYDENDLKHRNQLFWDDVSDEKTVETLDLNREWQRRHDQFHAIGYRDGLTSGKEASAQEGFNIGFKESVLVGYQWGLVRGVTSALACLPDGLKERLVETQENRNKFQHLYESLHSVSTSDALKLFHDKIITNKSAQLGGDVETTTHAPGLLQQNCYQELNSLLTESPAIEVHSILES